MAEDRRNQSRVRVSFPAFVFDGPTGQVTATVTDINSQGLCVSAPGWEESFAALDSPSYEVAFFATGVPWPIVLPCRRVWAREGEEIQEMGGMIEGGDPGSLLALHKFLADEVKAARKAA